MIKIIESDYTDKEIEINIRVKLITSHIFSTSLLRFPRNLAFCLRTELI